MLINTDGLVIMEQNIGESDRLITILTRDEGIIRAFVPGAKKLKNKNAVATQLLSYSHLVLYKGRDKYIINDAEAEEIFFSLRFAVEKLSLAQYFCELTLAFAPEQAEAGGFLRLLLNALYFLANDKMDPSLIKPVVEMRMLAMAGYMPDLIACKKCGQYETHEMFFLPYQGLLYCKGCCPTYEAKKILLDRGAVTALRHTIYAEFSKIFSFTLSKAAQAKLSEASEQYVIARAEKRFKTLEFYHQIC